MIRFRVHQFANAWRTRKTSTEQNWAAAAANLKKKREKLDRLVSALHRRHSYGMTACEAFGRVAADRGSLPEVRLAWPAGTTHAPKELERQMAFSSSGSGSGERTTVLWARGALQRRTNDRTRELGAQYDFESASRLDLKGPYSERKLATESNFLVRSGRQKKVRQYDSSATSRDRGKLRQAAKAPRFRRAKTYFVLFGFRRTEPRREHLLLAHSLRCGSRSFPVNSGNTPLSQRACRGLSNQQQIKAVARPRNHR